MNTIKKLSVISSLSLSLALPLNAGNFEKVFDYKMLTLPSYKPESLIDPHLFKQFYDQYSGGLTHFPQITYPYVVVDATNMPIKYTSINNPFNGNHISLLRAMFKSLQSDKTTYIIVTRDGLLPIYSPAKWQYSI